VCVCFFVEAIGAMTAATLTAIGPFEVVLFCKAFITLWREVVVSFF